MFLFFFSHVFALQRYINALTVPVEHLTKMVESFVHELEVGLDCHRRHPMKWEPKECSFKMLDACISKLPTGHEGGVRLLLYCHHILDVSDVLLLLLLNLPLPYRNVLSIDKTGVATH